MKTLGLRKLSILAVLVVLTGNVLAQQAPIQFFRPYNQKGMYVFETTKDDTVAFTGFKFRIGAGFTQGFQSFSHENKEARAIVSDGANTYIETAPGALTFTNRVTGAPVTGTFAENPNLFGGIVYTPTPGTTRYLTNSNQLYEMAGGFPLAQANLFFDVQLADGVKLNLISYMSSHHHNEFWVKGGYFQIDKVGFMNSEFMNNLWKNLTLKVGHMEVNYGDAHYRRSDGGHTLQNPFIENNIMDAFTTEIGGELYWQKNGVLLMFGYTDGEIQGNVTRPNDRSPNFYGKAAFDKQLNEDLRLRLSGSVLTTKSSIRNTIYGGDRTGSNYQFVMDNTAATVTGNFTSGRFNPGLTDNLTAIMINPFVKFKGLELFGTFETAQGSTPVENGEILPNVGAALSELDKRKATQVAVDLLYRFGKNEQFYAGAKYNVVNATIALGQSTNPGYVYQGDRYDVSIDRTAIGAGWYITPSVLFKAEYVMQNYTDFPGLWRNRSTSATGFDDSSIFAGGKFSGLVIQGAISF